MFFDRKLFKLPFYIFFLYFIVFFIKFSTVAYANEVYKIKDIKISEEFDSNFDKNETIYKAIDLAFEQLVLKITLSTDQKKLKKVKSIEVYNLVDSFAIIDEKFVKNKYIALFEVEFNKKRINNLLESNNIFPSIPKNTNLFVMPILIKNNQFEPSLLSENPFYLNWHQESEKYFLIKYILPNEDIEDINLIRENIDNLENYNFNKIINKYNLKDFIIIVIFENNKGLNVLSKVNLNKQYKIINTKYMDINIDNLNSIKNVIKKLKIIYEDEWKKINQINSSIKISATFSIDSKNYNLVNKLEKKLSEMDIVDKYYIDSFTRKEIIIKVIYNTTPDKFIREITSSGFNLDHSSSIWLVK
tara:strand:+ start:1273 stop:2349 length:1077 start_codon:yes stop_codon:yes gene_type:complete